MGPPDRLSAAWEGKQLAVMRAFGTPADFWTEMVEPDYRDARESPADLRAAFHAAISLFHMHDWVWVAHQATIVQTFTYENDAKAVVPPKDEVAFAKCLEQQFEDFGKISGIANAAKHLRLRKARSVPNAPDHAAKTATRFRGDPSGGYGAPTLAYGCAGSYISTPRVTLEGAGGTEIDFGEVARAVYDMWIRLRAEYGWW